MRIQGPVSLTELYNFKTKQWVYLFGDYHFLKSECYGKASVRIDKFLEYTLKQNKNKTIDIFVEVVKIDKYTTEMTKNKETYTKIYNHIDYVYNKFSSCDRQRETENDYCPYENLRFHNIDSEYRYRTKLVYGETASYLSDLMNNLEDLEYNYGKDIPKIVNAIKNNYLVKNNVVENFDEIVKYVLNMSVLDNLKISKQLLSVEPKTRKVLIRKTRSCMKNSHNKNIDSYRETKRVLLSNIKKTSDDYKLMADTMKFFIDTMVYCLIDLYFLARLLRTFDASKERNKMFPNRVNNAIVYAGNFHAKNISIVLTDLGFKVINYTYDEQQCIDVSKFEIPFFQTIPDPKSKKIYESDVYKQITENQDSNFKKTTKSPSQSKKKPSGCKPGYEKYPKNKTGRCLKKCKSNQYRSPETSRCRKRK
jgi:hypothetical protein